MKESYYTEHNIHTEASEFLKKISSLRSKHHIIPKVVKETNLILSGARAERTQEYVSTRDRDKIKEGFLKYEGYKIDPKSAALLVIDAQKFFLHNSSHAYVPSSEAIISRIVALQKYCLAHNILIIQTRHKESSTSMMQKWWHKNIPQEMIEIDERIRNAAIKVVDKTEYDAFHNSKLDKILKGHGITQVIITGVMTHLCCETTARSAFVRGYEVFFSIDGTATYNKEFHLCSLINLAHGFAVPMLVSEILEAFNDT